MQTISIRTDDIQTGGRHRALSDSAVDRLAGSMKELGLLQPITVRVADMMVLDGQEVEGVPVLVAGHHRLAAAKRLGWSHIECLEIDDDALRAELVEIAENLHRCDLTKEQRDEHIRRYAELLEAQARIVTQDAQQIPAPRGRPKTIARQIAENTGLSRDTVKRALHPKPKPVPPAPAPINVEDAIEKQVGALMNAWNKAGPEARERFLEQIDTPVFDNTRAAA